MTFIDLVRKVKEFEGFRDTAYRCPAGKLTIGYGHTNGVEIGDTITEEEATYLLSSELQDIYDYIKAETRGIYDFTENQLLALTSFCFNGGKGWLAQVTGNYCRSEEVIAEKMLLYDNAFVGGKLVKLQGLTKRRKWEHDLFLDNDEECRPAKICFKHDGLWVVFTGKCITINGTDYAVCEYPDTNEIVHIPETKIQSLEVPILFTGA